MSKLEQIYGEKLKIVTIGLTKGEENSFDQFLGFICNAFADKNPMIVKMSKYN